MNQNHDFTKFRESVDNWIKDVDGRMGNIEHLAPAIQENADNCNHNYELIKDLISVVTELKNDMKLVKKTQLLLTKSILEANGRKVEKEMISY